MPPGRNVLEYELRRLSFADALDASGSSVNIVARCKWAEGEVDLLLDLIHTLGLRAALLQKRNAKVFKLLSKEMAKRNCHKGAEKLRIKFQQLRRLYNKVKNGTGKTFEHFEAMRLVLDPTEEEAAADAEAEAHLSSASDSDFNDSDEEEVMHHREVEVDIIIASSYSIFN